MSNIAYHSLQAVRSATRQAAVDITRRHFRAYENAEAGVHDDVGPLLATHYLDALAAARTGDSAGYARALAHGTTSR